MKIKLNKEDKIADMPYYSIYLVPGEGYVVANKLTRTAKIFKTAHYMEVLDYAMKIGE